jgi:hypothetical protein
MHYEFVKSNPVVCETSIMPSDHDEPPIEIPRDADSLISTLRASGWILVEAHYDAKTMGNWYVDLSRGGLSLRLVKDRSQFFVTGPPVTELKVAGLGSAFDGFAEFQQAVVNWAIGSPSV